MTKFYVVKKGINPGIYNTWEECRQNVIGYKDAIYKSFNSMESALSFYNDEPIDTELDDDKLYIFTDGSYKKNIDKHCFATIIPQWDYKYSKVLDESTNNRNELLAILQGLIVLNDNRHLLENYREIIIVSDSDYCIKSLTIFYKKWFDKNLNIIDDSKKNLDIIRDILVLLKDIKVRFLKVKSHTNNLDPISYYNDIVDKLAQNTC